MSPQKKKMILVADNEPIIRYALSELIQTEPDLRLCAEVGDVPGMVSEIKCKPPDLIIMDFLFGPVPLLSLIKEITLEATPVIVITGELDDELRKYPLACGASSVLSKAYQPTDLLSSVAKRINRCDLKTMSNSSG